MWNKLKNWWAGKSEELSSIIIVDWVDMRKDLFEFTEGVEVYESAMNLLEQTTYILNNPLLSKEKLYDMSMKSALNQKFTHYRIFRRVNLNNITEQTFTVGWVNHTYYLSNKEVIVNAGKKRSAKEFVIYYKSF